MDKASDFGSEDCRFESCQGRSHLFRLYIHFHSNRRVIVEVVVLFAHHGHTCHTASCLSLEITAPSYLYTPPTHSLTHPLTRASLALPNPHVPAAPCIPYLVSPRLASPRLASPHRDLNVVVVIVNVVFASTLLLLLLPPPPPPPSLSPPPVRCPKPRLSQSPVSTPLNPMAVCRDLACSADAQASVAQWLEHWSCKPGVGSSILPGGTCFDIAALLPPILSLLSTFYTQQSCCHMLRLPDCVQHFHPVREAIALATAAATVHADAAAAAAADTYDALARTHTTCDSLPPPVGDHTVAPCVHHVEEEAASASTAQGAMRHWLEHWSSKPGVESSILSGGSPPLIFVAPFFVFYKHAHKSPLALLSIGLLSLSKRVSKMGSLLSKQSPSQGPQTEGRETAFQQFTNSIRRSIRVKRQTPSHATPHAPSEQTDKCPTELQKPGARVRSTIPESFRQSGSADATPAPASASSPVREVQPPPATTPQTRSSAVVEDKPKSPTVQTPSKETKPESEEHLDTNKAMAVLKEAITVRSENQNQRKSSSSSLSNDEATKPAVEGHPTESKCTPKDESEDVKTASTEGEGIKHVENILGKLATDDKEEDSSSESEKAQKPAISLMAALEKRKNAAKSDSPTSSPSISPGVSNVLESIASVSTTAKSQEAVSFMSTLVAPQQHSNGEEAD
ncbi:unnamed protein product [Mesocestoides corti]|uniref:Uncharacterized protein n=2 Tax=Mesocestoides corti TaxID=53468 RepID=A0A0R3U5I5_MESCO|nr:unnamed protein product [Mesocestoides corti]